MVTLKIFPVKVLKSEIFSNTWESAGGSSNFDFFGEIVETVDQGIEVSGALGSSTFFPFSGFPSLSTKVL